MPKLNSKYKTGFTNESGFTILETLISLAISGIIFTFVLNIFNIYSNGLNADTRSIHLNTNLREKLDAIMEKIQTADLALSDKNTRLKFIKKNKLGQVLQTLEYEIIQDNYSNSNNIWLLLEKTSTKNGATNRRVLLTHLLAPPKSQFSVINKSECHQIVQITLAVNWESQKFQLTRVASLRNSVSINSKKDESKNNKK